jgi:lipopolysaccharide/colanic/teichoic acid biosynthesis glycosyltransferase
MKSPNYEYLNGPVKRRLDVLGGITLSSIAAIPGALTGAVSAIDTGSLNPIFRQTRVGRYSQPLEVLKFRTIPKRLETNNVTPLGTFDPRATKVGMAIRDMGIDETPQLLSVLRGDMSLVGMRPLLGKDIERLESIDPQLFRQWYEVYEQTKPALTGPSQILRHNYRVLTDEVWQRVMQIDLEYAQNASLKNDLRMLGSTPVSLLVARANIVDNINQADALLNLPVTPNEAQAA